MSDNELDAELLALAGDDSSGDEDVEQPSSRARSPSHDNAGQGAKSRQKSPPARGTAQKVKRGARGSGARQRNGRRGDDSDSQDESDGHELEGEGSSPNSPDTLGSAAMDESDSDTSPGDIDNDAPLYPIEGKFRSEADRSTIMAMTEIEREEILAERAHQVEKRAQDQQLKRILQQRRREEAAQQKSRKRSGEAAGITDDSRASRAKRSLNPALDKYKEQRQLKSDQKARGEERRRDLPSPSRDHVDSDRDADGESEVEWDDVKPTRTREEPLPDLRDFERVRVGRSNFAKVCLYPTFESAIKGCFCRVSIGINKESGEPQYRMAQIKGFLEVKPYHMEGPHGKPFAIDQRVILAHGKQEKDWPFTACSDSRFTPSEFERYKQALATDNLRLPQKRFLNAKLDDIHALLDHNWTEQDIQNKINRGAALNAKYAKNGREAIVRRRDEAAARGDDMALARLNQELTAMDGGASGKMTTGSKSNGTIKGTVQQERLAALNKANRKANSEEVRKAQIAEKRAQQKARDEAIAKARKREADAAEAAKNKLLHPNDDLFGDASDISRTGTPLNGSGTPEIGTPGTSTPANGAKKVGIFRKKAMDDEVMGSIDLGIDIDI
ncbi:hypothetical protein AAFC00_001713 [Neodothiora populina]|uniref:Plus3 domain-containing protein n=1 Tax=Neodothiora populina TaxID=2781224 RepID=A0ABR3PPW4_9PEZI